MGGEVGKWGNDIHDIPRFNDQAPAGPDQTCACEGDVLGEGELFGGPVEVGDAGKDEAPLLQILALVQGKEASVKEFPGRTEYGLVESKSGMLCARMRESKGKKRGRCYQYLHYRSPANQSFVSICCSTVLTLIFLSRHSSKVQTHQKCTVLIPIGLSHNLFAQLWFPAGAAVLCHLLPCCWNRALVDRNACA